MAILGLFGKKSKASHNSSKSSHTASAGSVETDDPSVLSASQHHNGVYAGPSTASSSKSMLGLFKKSPLANASDGHLAPPMQRFSGARSDSGHDLLELPPNKSSLFSPSNDVLSTRSLPTHSHTDSRELLAVDAVATASPAKKSKGMFAWAHRDRKPSKPQSASPDVNLDSDSFNLRSFRHVRPVSPSSTEQLAVPCPPSSLSTSVLMPPQRPRNSSIASDASQRISVAAFREAARRSAANSPNPSAVDVSRMDPSLSLRPPSGTATSPSPTSLLATARRSTAPLSGSSDSSESEESESEDGDSAGSSTLRPARDRTITRRTAGKAKATSELGHRTLPAPPRISPVPSSGSKGSMHTRQRASHSTSALQPTPAAVRASMLAAERQSTASGSNSVSQARSKVAKHGNDSDTSLSSDDSDTDSDDAPLSRLVPPKRPGSATSNATAGSRTRIPPKPLIDISALDIKLPVISPEPAPASSISQSRAPAAAAEKGKGKERDEPFSPVSILSATEKAYTPVTSPIEKVSLSDRLALLAQGAVGRSVENLQKSPSPQPPEERPQEKGTRDKSQPPVPSRSQTLPVDNFLPPSPPSPPEPPSPSPSTMPKKNGRSMSTPAVAFEAVKDLSDPTPIVPTPIRERSPPPAFSVTSRPTSQLSVASYAQLSSSPRPVTTQQQQASYREPSPSAARVLPPRMWISPPSSQQSEASSPSTTPLRPAPLITEDVMSSSKGFTGGGLLAGAAAAKDRNTSASPAKRQSRQRAQTTNASVRGEELPSRPFMELNNRRHGSPARTNDASSQITSNSASSNSSSGQPKSILVPGSRQARPRSSTLAVVPPSFTASPPNKPFAAGPRGYSPASSTGDSSSGRTPVTPLDGSELEYDGKSKLVEQMEFGQGHGSTAIGARRRRRGQSVTFDEPVHERGRAPARSADELDAREMNDEQRRNERRRSEAKAAIELGNIVNGKAPIVTDDDDDSEGVGLENMGPRMSMFNPMMGMPPMQNMNMGIGMGMGIPPPTQMPWMSSPGMSSSTMPSPQQFMSMIPIAPPNADSAFLAAHQQAMHIAKQAYQMAVAQQAMAAAEEEWERGSNAATSVLGGMSRPNMAFPPPGSFGLGMPNMGAMGMGMGPWPNMIPSSSQSMYAGSTAGSELGYGSRGWGSRSAYGEPTGGYRSSSFGFPPVSSQPPPMPRSESANNIPQSQPPTRPGPRPRTRTAPNLENNQKDGVRGRQAPPMPPSSWKNARS